jgi:hypothetical protein
LPALFFDRHCSYQLVLLIAALTTCLGTQRVYDCDVSQGQTHVNIVKSTDSSTDTYCRVREEVHCTLLILPIYKLSFPVYMLRPCKPLWTASPMHSGYSSSGCQSGAFPLESTQRIRNKQTVRQPEIVANISAIRLVVCCDYHNLL